MDDIYTISNAKARYDDLPKETQMILVTLKKIEKIWFLSKEF